LDLKEADPVLFKSLGYIVQNDVADLDLYFQTDVKGKHGTVAYDLKPGGGNILVTEENKREYVNLFLDFRFQRGHAQQLHCIAEGFYEFVPLTMLSKFKAEQLELFLCGKSRIDVDDWKVRTCVCLIFLVSDDFCDYAADR
jgi:hypothetical protein